jgi:hypothetical protein
LIATILNGAPVAFDKKKQAIVLEKDKEKDKESDMESPY